MADLLIFETQSDEVDSGSLTCESIEGTGALSRLYRYELRLSTELDGGLAPEAVDDMLRKPCAVRIGADGVPIHGRLCEIEMLTMNEPSPVSYRAVLVPDLWRATMTRRSRIFQEKTIPDIVREVLDSLGLAEDETYSFTLDGTYPEREYVVQYQESDFDFISRWLEHYGITYYFVQEPDGARLVLTDANHGFAEPTDYEYRPGTGWAIDDRVVNTLTRTRRARPAMVVLRDYNWRIPSVQLQSEHATDETTGVGFTAYYGDHYKEPAEGDTLAQIRAEELMVDWETFRGTCRVPEVAPGQRITLAAHPSGDLDRVYVVTDVHLSAGIESGEQEAAFDKVLGLIDDERPFRPARTTPKPIIEGIMHAKIDGEVPGLSAPIDSLGRYKVLFPFDLEAAPGGKASRWVRMSQASSGPAYGIHFPLHIGVEVAIEHLGGDPDRPVIIGTVPNTETVSPVVDDNATQSRIKTKTGILVEFDDDVG